MKNDEDYPTWDPYLNTTADMPVRLHAGGAACGAFSRLLTRSRGGRRCAPLWRTFW